MKELTLTDHLTELRTRLIRIAIIIIVSFFVCYNFGENITEILLKPLRDNLDDTGKVVYLGILDKVLVQFQLAAWSAVIFSSPLWFYQLWLFIKPGLLKKEIKVIRPFVVVGFLLFCLGVSFGYFLVFPFGFKVIMAFGVDNIEATIGIKDYIVLSSKILLFLGVLFQLPNVMLILGFMGILSRKMLSEYRKYIYVFFAIISAVLTPPDAFTMMALMIPLCLLFELGNLGIMFITDPFRNKNFRSVD